jgi:purine-cytosine permease-like protein
VLVLGGCLGFLPVLGYWMIPLGLIILSIDFPAVRRFRRRWAVKLGLSLQHKFPNLALKVGYMRLRATRINVQPAE